MLVSIKNLSKHYNDAGLKLEVLQDINLELEAGKTATILGPSGSGKTSLLQVLALIEGFDGGSYHFNNHDVSLLSKEARLNLMMNDISIVYQQHNLLFDFSVSENIQIATAGKATTKQINTVLEGLQIGHVSNKRPSEISGGQAQRASIARALLRSPKLLLLDEPSGSLDEQTTISVMDLVFEAAKNLGIACILVTHNTELARYTNQTFLLKNGSLQLQASYTMPHTS
jgi:ABC-type lipoprotein export system ATPase subunit